MRRHLSKIIIWTSVMIMLSTCIMIGQSVPNHTYTCPHITGMNPWVTKISFTNNGDDTLLLPTGGWGAICSIEIYDVTGEPVDIVQDPFNNTHIAELGVLPFQTQTLVFTDLPDYVQEENEIILPPLDGWCRICSESDQLVPKVSYRYADSPAVCEFFLSDTTSREQLLVNPQYDYFDWVGIALVNPGSESITLAVTAYKNGEARGTAIRTLLPGAKLVDISSTFWQPSIEYADVDQIRISSDKPLPLAMSISGNNTLDRFLFFLGYSTESPISVSFDAVPEEVIAGTSIPIRFIPTHSEGKPMMWYSEIYQPPNGRATMSPMQGGPISSGQEVQTMITLPDPGTMVTVTFYVYDLDGHSLKITVR